VADRAELLLKQAARFGLKTRSECLEHLGSHFRAVLGSPPRKTDYQVCTQQLGGGGPLNCFVIWGPGDVSLGEAKQR